MIDLTPTKGLSIDAFRLKVFVIEQRGLHAFSRYDALWVCGALVACLVVWTFIRHCQIAANEWPNHDFRRFRSKR